MKNKQTTNQLDVLGWIDKLRGTDLTKWPCSVAGCHHGLFKSHQARNNHIISNHPGEPLPKMSRQEALARQRLRREIERGGRKKYARSDQPFDRKKYRYLSDTPEYRHQRYVERYKKSESRDSSNRFTPEGRKRLSLAMKAMWKRKRIQREGLSAGNSRRKIEPIVYRAPFEVPVTECPSCKLKFPPGITWRAEE